MILLSDILSPLEFEYAFLFCTYAAKKRNFWSLNLYRTSIKVWLYYVQTMWIRIWMDPHNFGELDPDQS